MGSGSNVLSLATWEMIGVGRVSTLERGGGGGGGAKASDLGMY